jgi:hypothetical protein
MRQMAHIRSAIWSGHRDQMPQTVAVRGPFSVARRGRDRPGVSTPCLRRDQNLNRLLYQACIPPRGHHYLARTLPPLGTDVGDNAPRGAVLQTQHGPTCYEGRGRVSILVLRWGAAAPRKGWDGPAGSTTKGGASQRVRASLRAAHESGRFDVTASRSWGRASWQR